MNGKGMRIITIAALVLVIPFPLGLAWAGNLAKTVIPLRLSEGVAQGSGEAVISDSSLVIRVQDLKPDSVYTVWYVNTQPREEVAGVGKPPYEFRTDRNGAARFRAKLSESPFGKWQMLVIIRHPSGDPTDMQHKEDALWAQLARSAGAAGNPCAAKMN